MPFSSFYNVKIVNYWKDAVNDIQKIILSSYLLMEIAIATRVAPI